MLCLEDVAVAWRFGGAGFPPAAGKKLHSPHAEPFKS